MFKNRFLFLALSFLALGFFSCMDTPEGPVGPGDEFEITGIQPDEGPPGVTVTISGMGFDPNPTENSVTIGGSEAEVTESSVSEIQAIVPEEAETGPVEVTVDGETTTGPVFTVTEESPAIERIEPDSGPPGTQVTITGVNFGDEPGAIEIFFADTPADLIEASETELITEVPEDAESGPVEVIIDGTSATGPTFTVTSDAPEIDAIDPESGPVGTEVTITGNNFGDDPNEIEVRFAGTLATLINTSDSVLIAEVPENAESGPVEVTVGEESVTGPEFIVESESDDSYKVEGTVTDHATGQGVEGVEINLSSSSEPILTDNNGAWSAEGLEGPVVVNADAAGWDFPVHTRLVLAASTDVNFEAHTSYDPPTGTRIAYQFREDCSQGTACDIPYHIWTMASNGLDKEQLTDDQGSDHNPTWSPDATQIAFDSDRESSNGERQIWIMNSDGSELTDTGVEGSQPEWSPDGSQIAYVYDSNIYVMDMNGNQTEIYNSEGNWASSPTWSPEGSKIAFTLNEGGTSDTHIWVMESDGENATRLTDSNAPNRDPSWKPSGEAILYASRPSSVDRMRLMDIDGTNDRTENWPDHAQRSPIWSPSGGEIVYVSRRMIPISDRIRRTPATSNEWSNLAPDSGAEDEFWATSPAWAPQ